jgi:hypothetical protein
MKNLKKKKCQHKNAIFGWSHDDYLGYCSECNSEVTEDELK